MSNTSKNTSKTHGNRRIVYTDGGAHNNGIMKGIGAWAFVEYDQNVTTVDVHCGFVADTTNNRTEMIAIINAISNYDEHTDINIISDSGYVVNGYNNPSYLDRWILNGWRTSTNSPVLNKDLWESILALTYKYGIKFTLIHGHYKDPDPTNAFWNAIVDRACTYVMQNSIYDEHIILQFNVYTKQFTIKGMPDVVLCELKTKGRKKKNDK